MNTFKEKTLLFSKIFKISLIISLIFIILILYLFPKFDKLPEMRKQKIEIEIYVSDIPQTKQKTKIAFPPRAPYGVIPIPSERDELPEEITFPESDDIGSLTGNLLTAGVPPEIPAKPILEVYPNVSGVDCKGYVRLLLLINKLGKVESIEVLENTTLSNECQSLTINAVKRNLWIPAKVDNKPVKSWVTKTYKFNIIK